MEYVTEDKAYEKMDMVLAEKCPTAQRVKGNPSPHKVIYSSNTVCFMIL